MSAKFRDRINCDSWIYGGLAVRIGRNAWEEEASYTAHDENAAD